LAQYIRHIFLLILSILGFVFYPASGIAQNAATPALKKSFETTLHIASDKLISNRNEFNIIFSGNVRAVYGDTTITSDELKVFYLGGSDSQAQLNEEKIDKIIATGHVTIQFDGKTAYCDQAVYTATTKTILMTGSDTRIQSDDNYINGDKITIDQLTGQILVEGNPEKRVNAVFKPEKGSIDIFDKANDGKQK
jgi:lipopolysaccharide export system protein LptA